MTQSSETIKAWLDKVNTEGHDLSPWESGFMESITAQFDERGSLSDRQEDILERIYAEKTR